MSDEEAFEVGRVWGAFVISALIGLLPLLVGSGRKQAGQGFLWFSMCVFWGYRYGMIASVPLAILGTVIIAMSGDGKTE